MNYASTEQLMSFEEQIRQLWESGDLPFLMHLSGGNEKYLIDIFESINEGDWIFGSHRSHYHAILAGIPRQEVMSSICRGDSMFLFSKERNFYTSAILAGTCGIAVGVAMELKSSGSKNHVWCFLGDGAEEQGHFYEAVLYATGHNLPVTFIIEDNRIQVDTPQIVRRGMEGGLIDAWPCVQRYVFQPRWPHAGSGCSHKIEFKPIQPT